VQEEKIRRDVAKQEVEKLSITSRTGCTIVGAEL
jgi:hypothetical protein